MSTYEKAIEHYGRVPQMVKAIEELGELSTEIARNILGVYPADDKIVDEVADVTIMMRQLAIIFGEKAVEDRIEFKLTRLQGRIEFGEDFEVKNDKKIITA